MDRPAAGHEAMEGGAWLQVSCALFTDASGTRPSVPWRELEAAVERWRGDGAFRRFFFLRKPPGLRLRFFGEGLADRLEPELLSWMVGAERSDLIRGFRLTLYEPEESRFGGPVGMAIAHDHFDRSSRFALAYEALSGGEQASLSRHVLSAAMSNHLFAKAAEDQAEVWDVWSQLARSATEFGGSATGPYDGSLRSALELGGAFWDALTPSTSTLVERALEGNEATAERLRAASDAGRLMVGKRAWLAAATTFHWNQLGLGLEPERLSQAIGGAAAALDPQRESDARGEHPGPNASMGREDRAPSGGGPVTVLGIASAQLRALCEAVEAGPAGEKFVELFDDLVERCGDRDADLPPRWSGVTDDCTPFELSIAIRAGQPDVRVLVEAQVDPPSPASYWRSGLGVNEWFADRLDADLDRFATIADLFVPDEGAEYAIWHGIELRGDGTMVPKIYLNPLARGVDRATVTMAEAVDRLGLARAWPAVARPIGPESRPTHLSLDLTPEAARVKIYVRSWDPSLEDLEEAYGRGRQGGSGDAASFCHGIAGLSRMTRRPITATFHLSDPRSERPERVALHIPPFPYAWNDEVIRRRVIQVLTAFELPRNDYQRSIEALATGPLDRQRGLHSYLSFQRESDGGPRVTVYFGGRIYRDRYGPLSLAPERTWPSPVAT